LRRTAAKSLFCLHWKPWHRACDAPACGFSALERPRSAANAWLLEEIVMTALKLLKSWIVPAALALAVGACAGDATHRSTGRYIDDATITAAVKSKLIGDETVKASNINVDTYNGVVQLSGFVETKDEASQAVALAEEVEGVKSVKDDLRLRQ
jgi:hypothetical protein